MDPVLKVPGGILGGGGGGPIPSIPLDSINVNGWSATYATPPTEYDPVGDPITFAVSRSGFNAAGAVVTVSDTLTVMKRVRQPYPSHASLTTDQVALSEFVFSDDSITGVTNYSTRGYPLPVAHWLRHDKEIASEASYVARLAVAHAFARSGRPVAAVKFIATDGSTTVEALAATMSTISYSASGFTIPHFSASLDFSGFANGATVTIDAIIYPWVGGAFQISVDADTYPSPNLTTLRVLCNRTGAYGTAYAYVSPAGASGSPAVSTDPAVAEANYYGTLDAAATALKAFNNSNYGRNYCDGGVIRLLDGAAHIFSNAIRTPGATLNWPLVIEAANAANRATTILRDRGSTMANSLPDQCIFRNLTIQRSGTGSWVCYDNAAANLIYTAKLIFDSCLFDANGATPYAGYIYKTGVCYFINCDEVSRFAQGLRLSTVNKATHVIGSKGDFASGPVTSVILASHCIGPDVFMLTGPAVTGVPELVGQLCSHSHLQLTANAKNAFSVNTAIGARGLALVGCVVESVGGETSPAIYVGGDGNTTAMQNILSVGITCVGSRTNYLYQDAGSTTIAKSGWLRFNVMQLRNTKSDVFGANANLVGNWPAIYNVGSMANAWLLGSNSDDTYLAGSWLGEVAALGEVTGIDADPLEPDWADDASFAGSGLGGGDYTPGPSNELPTIPSGLSPYPFDMLGNAVADDGSALVGALQSE